VPTVTRSTSAKMEGNLELDYMNRGLKWNLKPVAHLLEAFVHYDNFLINEHDDDDQV